MVRLFLLIVLLPFYGFSEPVQSENERYLKEAFQKLQQGQEPSFELEVLRLNASKLLYEKGEYKSALNLLDEELDNVSEENKELFYVRSSIFYLKQIEQELNQKTADKERLLEDLLSDLHARLEGFKHAFEKPFSAELDQAYGALLKVEAELLQSLEQEHEKDPIYLQKKIEQALKRLLIRVPLLNDRDKNKEFAADAKELESKSEGLFNRGLEKKDPSSAALINELHENYATPLKGLQELLKKEDHQEVEAHLITAMTALSFLPFALNPDDPMALFLKKREELYMLQTSDETLDKIEDKKIFFTRAVSRSLNGLIRKITSLDSSQEQLELFLFARSRLQGIDYLEKNSQTEKTRAYVHHEYMVYEGLSRKESQAFAFLDEHFEPFFQPNQEIGDVLLDGLIEKFNLRKEWTKEASKKEILEEILLTLSEIKAQKQDLQTAQALFQGAFLSWDPFYFFFYLISQWQDSLSQYPSPDEIYQREKIVGIAPLITPNDKKAAKFYHKWKSTVEILARLMQKRFQASAQALALVNNSLEAIKTDYIRYLSGQDALKTEVKQVLDRLQVAIDATELSVEMQQVSLVFGEALGKSLLEPSENWPLAISKENAQLIYKQADLKLKEALDLLSKGVEKEAKLDQMQARELLKKLLDNSSPEKDKTNNSQQNSPDQQSESQSQDQEKQQEKNQKKKQSGSQDQAQKMKDSEPSQENEKPSSKQDQSKKSASKKHESSSSNKKEASAEPKQKQNSKNPESEGEKKEPNQDNASKKAVWSENVLEQIHQMEQRDQQHAVKKKRKTRQGYKPW